MREAIAAKALLLLKKHSFGTSDFFRQNSCFDIAAKKGEKVFLIKILSNIDALREEQALELKRLATAFNATVLIIGEKTKSFSLKDNMVYERYGVQAITIKSFSELLENRLPQTRFFKGKETVAIDAEKLRKKRKQMGLTLSELAERIDSSTQAIHRYEKNESALLPAAQKLENALHTKLIKQIDILQKPKMDSSLFEEKITDDYLEKIQKLGLELALFEHAPFRAYSKPEDALLIDKGYSKEDLKRKAINLEKAKTVAKGAHSVIISKEQKYSSIASTPIIQEEELESFSRARDLLETIKEREKQKKGK